MFYGRIGQGCESGKREGNFSKGSIWWRDLGKTTSEGVGNRNWFSSSIVKVIGEGNETSFWHDVWASDVPLSVKYCRLYSISNGKHWTIQQQGTWEEGVWTWKFPWRRRFFTWEQELFNKLMEDLQQVHISHGNKDRWAWKHTTNGEYSVSSAYNALTSDLATTNIISFKTLWKANVPLKVAGFAWKLMQQRLPTRYNLGSKNFHLNGSETLCPFCQTEEETEQHVFFKCEFATNVWSSCSRWWGVFTVRNLKTKEIVHS